MTYLASLVPLAAIYGILVIGLNMQYGVTGILNFTYITFVAIGAYVTGVLTMGAPANAQTYILGAHLPFLVALVLGGLAAAAVGAVISFTVLRRLRSDYLAIVTIGAGQIVYTIIGNETGLFNGWNGIFGIPVPVPMSLSPVMQQLAFGLITILILAVVLFAAQRIQYSPLGRVLRAIRDDEGVTEAYGRDTFRMKLLAFLIGCFVAGIGGGLLGEYATAYAPSAFLPGETFILWAALLIGGVANNWGALLGAIIVPIGFAEVTRFLPDFGNPTLIESLRGVAIGLLIILAPAFLPHGLVRERLAKDRARSRATAPTEEETSNA